MSSDSGYRAADTANGDERRPLRCPDLSKDVKDLGHRFLVDKCASECELEARRRGCAIRERVRIGLQRDIVLDHCAEPADRIDCPGRQFRVVAVKGDVDLDRCVGSAAEWIGKFHVLGHTIEEQAPIELTERGVWEPKLTVDGMENNLAATAFTADQPEVGHGASAVPGEPRAWTMLCRTCWAVAGAQMIVRLLGSPTN